MLVKTAPPAEPSSACRTSFTEDQTVPSGTLCRLMSRSCAVTHRFGSHSCRVGCDGRRCCATASWTDGPLGARTCSRYCRPRPHQVGDRNHAGPAVLLVDKCGSERNTSRAWSRLMSRSCAVTYRVGSDSCRAGCDGRHCGATARQGWYSEVGLPLSHLQRGCRSPPWRRRETTMRSAK
jgi:hypothetical protein